jgi:uncharacterized protein YndB with AHSA1/START domain
MDVLEAQVLIRAAPERVMPFLIDPELLPLWSPTEVLVKRLSRRKTGVGVRLRMEFVERGLDPIEYEVLEQTETTLVCSFAGRMTGRDTWTLKRKGKGTEVHNRMEFDRPDMVTFLGWKAVGKVIAEADMRAKMPLLKKSVETAVCEAAD